MLSCMPRPAPFRLATHRLQAPLLGLLALTAAGCAATSPPPGPASRAQPYLIVLGIAQDGGSPQAGTFAEPGWEDPAARRNVVCLGLVDPASARRWMFEATPDFPTQLRTLCLASPARRRAVPILDGIFLTHAHIGHYTGLMYLGHEAMGARGVPVYAMPRMRSFLESNGPWSQLVNYHNIALRTLHADEPIALESGDLMVTPIAVPHRQEYSEVVGFRIAGPHARVLFLPDIDSWDQWDAPDARGAGHLERELAGVDVAYVDGTFFSGAELPGRNMLLVPHPPIERTMARLASLPAAERAKVRFIHLNHTNPALTPGSPAQREIRDKGFRLAVEGETVGM
jgi:pyrroloquinoline quinone biosynthesis protein B